jgi:hypothetical protein
METWTQRDGEAGRVLIVDDDASVPGTLAAFVAHEVVAARAGPAQRIAAIAS